MKINSGECLVPFGTEFYAVPFATRNMKIKAGSNIILHVVLHECETWSLIPRKEHQLILREHGIKEGF